MDAILSFCMHMTSWQWMSFGVALLSFELMFPGILMGWLSIGAFLTAAIVYFTGLLGFPAIIIFFVLGALSCLYAKKGSFCCFKTCSKYE